MSSRHFKVRIYRGAPWGPVHVHETGDRIRASVPGSGEVEIEAPFSGDVGKQTTLAMVADGLAVTVDGQHRFTLRQAEHGLGKRADRVVSVEALGGSLPAGTHLRARGINSMGLEVGDPHGETRRLIRPGLDLFHVKGLGLTFGHPEVDASVPPDVIAMWGAAEWHLLETVHR